MQDILLYVLIGALGIITTVSDQKKNIISNKTLIICFLLGVVVNLFFSFSDTLLLFLNSLISFCLGYLLYVFNIWAAGDAKLFMVYSLLIPLNVYQNLYIPIFPSLILLTNVFIIASITIFFIDIDIIRFKFSKKIFGELFGILLSIFSFSWIIRKFIVVEKSSASILISYMAAFFIYKLISRFLKRKKIVLYFIMGAGIISRFIYEDTIILSFVDMIIYSVIFVSISALMMQNADRVKIMKIVNLKSGMVIIEDNKTLLSSKNLEKVKQRLKNKETIEIKSTVPLAPLMFISILITILIRGEIITFLWRIFL